MSFNRNFLLVILISFFSIIYLSAFALPENKSSTRKIAVTVDDLPGVNTGGNSSSGAIMVNERIVTTLKKNEIPAIGFVNAGRKFPDNPEAIGKILKIWTDAGIELGNHTAKHTVLHKVSLSEFTDDIKNGQMLLKQLLGSDTKPVRYFRHPCLQTGRSLEIRESVKKALDELNLKVAPVTFDNGEWVFAAAYHKAIIKRDHKSETEIAKAYIAYMEQKLMYFESQSMKLLNREIPQIMLIHSNRLNADHLPALLEMLIKRGYCFVSLDSVLKDEAYALPETFIGPGGISWLHRWALTKGYNKDFFENEPYVPNEILERAGVKSE
ncbi:MAG: polysaccharide deacetylase family protein [Candidatus Riflebacteria bacterium]|nr:polysaccharide deacetylase family protein [Candidatus Riflebacteria bacterium]